ncbi:lauroyl acyltransferase, partial [Fusobacterium mortiferum]|nr:lauroyl acyltransferase [Fusobacterium mortiferum]
MKNFSYKIQFLIIMIFYKLLLLFPESTRFKFGDFLGILMYKLVKKRRLIALANLKMAFPEKDQHEVEA